MRQGLLLLLLLLAGLTGCSSDRAGEDAAPSPDASPSAPAVVTSPTVPGLPQLAAAPEGDVGLWLDTVGVPVVAAVRTSTPLAQLADVPAGERAATCRQVAADLDGIASPQVLTGLAITLDPETATLLVGDLQAKADLLAACEAGAADLEERITEVARTHAVAVAWLGALEGGR